MADITFEIRELILSNKKPFSSEESIFVRNKYDETGDNTSNLSIDDAKEMQGALQFLIEKEISRQNILRIKGEK